MIRAVLDANVLVSAILSPGGMSGAVIAAWRAQRFLLITPLAILTEIERALSAPKIARRHGWSPSRLRAFLGELAYFSLQTPGELRLTLVKARICVTVHGISSVVQRIVATYTAICPRG